MVSTRSDCSRPTWNWVIGCHSSTSLGRKRVRTDGSRSLNGQALSHTLEKQWINHWELDFYLKVMRKRNLTPKQAAKKQQINEKFLFNMKRGGRVSTS